MVTGDQRGFPRQADFKSIAEDWGEALLSDGALMKTRLILSDLVVLGEDVLGPQVNFGQTLALRVICPRELLEKVRDKPLVPPGESVPLTRESGYETVGVVEVKQPTQSIYIFNGYRLTVRLEIIGVARTLSYKTMSGVPPYNIRWSASAKVEKAPEGQ